MTAEQFDLLVDNLKRDKVLTSAPLIYQEEILSGNHRSDAAIKAGIEEADCIEITSPLTESQKRAIQLSHNAVTGQDDQNLLAALYGCLDIGDKLYSGLSDDVFKGLQDIDTAGLSIGTPRYEEIVLAFLAEDHKIFEERLKQIEAHAKKKPVRVAALLTFDQLFEAIVAVKRRSNIHNSALALEAMAELALERIAQLEAADGDAEEEADGSKDQGKKTARKRSTEKAARPEADV